MRDEFTPGIRDALGRRASFICSNPECRALTLAPSAADPEKYVYIGKAAHICAASAHGPRFDPRMTHEERSAISNGIFLCSGCADVIDRNGGVDFSVEELRSWKAQHEVWVLKNLNRSPHSLISVVAGKHHARGVGEVVGIDAEGPVFFHPGTTSTAEGVGNVTATRIGQRKGS